MVREHDEEVSEQGGNRDMDGMVDSSPVVDAPFRAMILRH